MPIHVGPQKFEQNVDAELADEGEALFELLGAEVRQMTPGEQLEVVTALQSGGWAALGPGLRERFCTVADAFLSGGPPE